MKFLIWSFSEISWRDIYLGWFRNHKAYTVSMQRAGLDRWSLSSLPSNTMILQLPTSIFLWSDELAGWMTCMKTTNVFTRILPWVSCLGLKAHLFFPSEDKAEGAIHIGTGNFLGISLSARPPSEAAYLFGEQPMGFHSAVVIFF